jgi:hypothetical protein
VAPFLNMKNIANIIEYGVNQYKKSNDKKERSAIKCGIKMLIRKTEFGVKPLWSKSAMIYAQENNIPLDLEWKNQPKYDPGRKNLLMEHKNPVEEIWLKLLESPENIFDTLKSHHVLVWVTREEDKRLNKLGYRSKRPDSNKAYKEAGIQIC